MTKIKLCGLSRINDIDVVNALKPDYIGFVFVKNSKRTISFEQAKQLKKRLNNDIKVVGVFVDEDIEIIKQVVDVIDSIQLHGSEDNEYIHNLRKSCDKQIIKAIQVKEKKDIEEGETSIADYILFDSGKGSGKTFDWNLLKNSKRPYFLAGGLDEENVQQAIGLLHPFGVDVSSTIETNGYKDAVKMKRFVENVRKGENDE